MAGLHESSYGVKESEAAAEMITRADRYRERYIEEITVVPAGSIEFPLEIAIQPGYYK